MEQQGGGEVVEEASPISSRPPANQLEEIMRFSGDDGGGGGGGGAAGAGGSSSSGGNRWPREETLALLRIRSEMDGTFRDATLKAPLWEDVSRKLGGLGYKRSAKKCKEKFENVQKYYKRTKEGKGGRNDGKAYKFFSQLEALNTATAAATSSSAPPPSSATLDVTPLSVANPPPHHLYHQQHQQQQPQLQSQLQPQPQPQQQQQQTPFSATVTPTPPFGGGAAVSSHSSSTASRMGYDDDDDDDDDDNNMDVDPANTAAGTSSRKRKRMAKEHGSRNMMEFFEAMMRQVLQKQAAMQRSLLEALEKREQERLSREEAWKRQEMSRLAREHELMAQERAASASRDAAIVSLIQKITGHTLHLPPSLTVSSAPPPRPPSPPPPPPPQQITLQQQRSQVAKAPRHQTSSAPSQLQPIMAIPEQQIPPPPRPPPPPQPQPQPQPRQEKQPEMVESGSSEPASSSRWPKTEVLALINLRSGMESKYQEAGPKGPLWEEISGGMRRIGYNRSAKRCKEKWENINKYYKKIKESNKKRPEDAKTCPYFHQLEALYHDKILGSSSSSTQHPKESSEVDPVSGPRPPAASHASPSSSENKNEEHAEESSPGGLSTQGDKGTEEKPEDIVRELMQRQQVAMNEYEKMEEEEGEGFDMEEEEEKNMGYEVEFQRRDNGPNRGGSGARTPSFLTMVQ